MKSVAENKIDNQTITEEQLAFLHKSALELVESSDDKDLYKYAADSLHDILPDSFVLINSYEEESGTISAMALSGIPLLIHAGLKIIGKSIQELKIKKFKFPEKLKSGRIFEVNGGIAEISGGAIPDWMCKKLEKSIQIKAIFALGFIRGQKLFGNAVIFARKEDLPINKNLIETLSKQISMAMERDKAEKKYKTLTNNLPGLVYSIVSDEINTIQYVNDNFNKITGYKPEEIKAGKGHILRSIMPEEEALRIDDEIEQLRKTEAESFELNYSIIRKDGRLCYIHEKGTFSRKLKPDTFIVDGIIDDITPLVLAKESLKIQKKYFEKLFENNPDAVMIFTADRKIKQVNKKFTELFGYSCDELDGKDFIKLLIPDEDKKKVDEVINKSLNGKEDSYTAVRKTETGKLLNVHVQVKPIMMDDDQLAIYAIYRDITARLIEEKTRQLVYSISEKAGSKGSLDDFLAYIHTELSQLIDTENFYIALYHPEDDAYSFPYHVDKYDSFSKDERINLKNSLTDYIRKTGKAVLFRDGEETIVNDEILLFGEASPVWLGAPLLDESEATIVGVLAIQNYEDPYAYTDKDLQLLEFIARNIGSFIEKRKTEIILRENEERLRNFVEFSNIGIWCFRPQKPIDITIDKDILITEFFNSVCISCNKTYADMMGIEKEEMIGVVLKDLMPDNPVNRSYFQSFINNNFSVSGATSKEINKQGKEKFFSNSMVGTIISGKLIEAWGTQIDISERVHAVNALTEAKKKAEASDRLKTSFLANMSHEIRTPMNAILGFSDLLSEEDYDENKRKQLISHISQNGDTLMNLIDDIIDIAKLEAGEIKIHKTLNNINELCEKCFNSFKTLNNNNNLAFHYKYLNSTSNDIYLIDSFRISQLINNLLSNAVKFTEAGSIQLICEIQAGTAKIKVKDTGIGIAKEKQELIFERFRQVDEDRLQAKRGTGLGLSICKKIIELMGGSIHVESILGKGSTFTLTLPLEK